MAVPRVLSKFTSQRREGMNRKTLHDSQNTARFPETLKVFLSDENSTSVYPSGVKIGVPIYLRTNVFFRAFPWAIFCYAF